MWFNPIVIGLLRSPLHGVMSASTALFTLRGRQSGRSITLPANYTVHEALDLDGLQPVVP